MSAIDNFCSGIPAEPEPGPNWRTAGDEAPAPTEARTTPKETEKKPAAEAKEERGFFGRLMDRITPGEAAAKPEPQPAVELQPTAEPLPAVEPQPAVEAPKPAPAQEEAKDAKPAEEAERGFFGRMLEKIGL